MKNRYKILLISIAVLAVFATSCEKEGELVVKPVKEFIPIEFKGFVMRDTLEQYFNGIKMRDLYGRIMYNGRIAFEDDAPIAMDLRKKSSGEVLYSTTIEQDDPADESFTFFYDGTKVTNTFAYPDAIPGVDQIAFYFDFPDDMPVDIVYGDGSDINSVTYLARDVKPKQRTEYFQIAPLDGEMYVLLLKAGTKEYLLNNDVNYSYMSSIQLPSKLWGSQGGGVKSMYVALQAANGIDHLVLAESDLVQSFGK
ncbi:hypothetical protein FAZ19_21630 [Sphingobacterium alkalisoli]|uniref:DUF4397 domain-containing protein n=1 Tax=Sphingobacterium alkalisoli TaxID=1874115 RepID=A0A4U0GRB3_9SPHI|nr:hypothetical protein [Sphingobacterium alkalisoli]TJY61501.1 hypothetical protein FAZ19_21630 [Sphingobacterium alkalisoli]GGH30008.1 hypothetical protein GCM10011418_41720 [Sphingobacterium alkalisoli]